MKHELPIILKSLFYLLLMFSILYGITAWVEWEADPSEWTKNIRFCTALIGGLGVYAAIMISVWRISELKDK